MILIVDSGSTKSDWIAVDIDGVKRNEKLRTKGLNPEIISEIEIKDRILENKDLVALVKATTHVFFYGAGCGTQLAKSRARKGLKKVFKTAQIEVYEDTLAAVYATINTKTEAAVVCILGTGSNCSYFDGTKLHQKVESLGYIIMDDASGNYYGRQLIRDYYFNKMPENIKIAFETKYNMDADFIKEHLYKLPSANAYLANFAEFLFLNKDSEYAINVIKSGIRLFSENMILQYKEHLKTAPVHFAGSIAYFAKDEINQIASEMGYKVGNIERRPIEGLVKYHLNLIQNS